MPAAPEWVELTKANGEIDAHLIAGGLESEGIETHLEKDAGVWRYGATDPFALVTVYVRASRLADARKLLSETGPEAYEFESEQSTEGTESPDLLIRNRSLRWWVAALIAIGLALALLRSSIPEVLF